MGTLTDRHHDPVGDRCSLMEARCLQRGIVAALLIDRARHDPGFSHATRSSDEKTVGSMDSGGSGDDPTVFL
jgi:hypothetical protein